ncbi:MAG: dissimilatory-type sulfite reductase subunit beta [Chloroflexi bacterium]|nr:dissimilatory-type sulfite reductase subunit beta [Chloroflexota bacterium]
MLRHGVLVHVSETGTALYTVRAGSPRLVNIDFIRRICDLADRYAEGYLRFTSRNNVEFMLPNKDNIDPLIAELEGMGIPVGGTGRVVHNMLHSQGWMHCHTPASADASGITKAVMDELYEYFKAGDLPHRVKIAFACCTASCGGIYWSDIAILALHRRPPKVNHEYVWRVCEIPTTLASCPVAAIKPTYVNGKSSVTIDEDKCVYCGNCYSICSACEIIDPVNDVLSIWAGGKLANARSEPMLGKLVVPALPSNPPRWPEVVAAVKKIVEVYAQNARKYERVGEWINRIGWPRFFELTGFEFTKYHIDDHKHAGQTYKKSVQLKF